ncbi:hypothetical protein LTR35_009731 [Friedmanniomyces endolithicus]|uniref:Copper acquisition factor BIM1-like domain-containing protein n=1 Tax=Friedmanniomyces endolithicus TaxID=329885 RepID=A0AAN6FRA1_9PEZI|nr:hypothetical protein LTR35_009731 [Friedmanniomyces endolithicus]KAK0301064.1 hypothetical protein LTS00_000213 [Friedmanniomyces endolithicus]KAK0321349.1 hypothetical protein LTR82_007801 [Friedmanniomyces endolithicus]KAK1018859.1 hypothetical protein LTR54_000670 [Friedmanniomyces endolithicus]
MYSLARVLAAATVLSTATAHTVITYPGWRGDNLHTNGTLPEDCPECTGIDRFDNGTVYFPWGMQWMYPCGGMPQTNNRSSWPISGGALSVQPGWFPGHSKAQIYVNIGIQEMGALAPPNMSHPVVPPFEITGPNNNYYPGQWCIPQIGMPANVSLQVGQNITLQVIELAQHGAALYSVRPIVLVSFDVDADGEQCVDLTLVEDGSSEVETVTPENCYNSTESIGFQLVFTTAALASGAPHSLQSIPNLLALVGILVLSAVFATL